jgi:hypothetical protein
MKNLRNITILLLIFLTGFFLCKFINLRVDYKDVDMAQISKNMYAHQDVCIQEYQDGLAIAEEIKTPYLLKKYLQQERYLTTMDVTYSKEVWVENCMYQKETYDTVGLGL